MKKFIASLVFLLIVAAAVFFIGWVQFLVPPGNFAVLISKTSGFADSPIESGVFSWHWERLLPTNTSLRIFNLSPHTETEEVSGSLPSADLYAEALSDKTNFSYHFDLSLSVRADPKNLVRLVQEKDFPDQESLDSWLLLQIKPAAQAAAEFILSEADKNPSAVPAIDTEAVRLALNESERFPFLEITDLSLIDARIPDQTLYRLARDTWLSTHPTDSPPAQEAGAAVSEEESQTADMDQHEAS